MRRAWLLPVALLPLALLAATPDGGAVLIAAVSFVGVVLVAVRMSTPADSHWLPQVVVAGFLAKLLACVLSYAAIVVLFNGKADAVAYHGRAIEAADLWRRFQVPPTKSLTGTSFMDLATSLLFTPYEPTLLGGFILFAPIGFLGQMLMYAAFRRGAPSAQLKWYAALVFFYPSIVYWTAPISKEAFMFLFMGLIVYGSARMLENLQVRWLIVAAVGFVPAVLLRAHVAALLGASLFAATLIMRNPPGTGVAARRLLSLWLAVIALAGLVFTAAADFNIDLSAAVNADAELAEEFDSFLGDVEENTSTGGSSVGGGFVTNPIQLPGAAMRVIYRPFPWEADNAPAFVTAVEGVVLLLVTVWRAPASLKGVRRIRDHPYLLLCAFYSVGFVIAFSGILNLGLMARQRSQVLPFLLALLLQLPTLKNDPATTGSIEEAKARHEAGPSTLPIPFDEQRR